jgi:hypothetical protein
MSIMRSQQADPEYLPRFTSAPKMAKDYRVAEDGVLEKEVEDHFVSGGKKWVVVIPQGQATALHTWKDWVFLQTHVGLLGAHRPADKTTIILRRLVWWRDMGTDIAQRVSRCLTCLRYRKVHTKQVSPEVIPTEAEPWQDVMVDMEGPSNPPDRTGCIYIMTYIDTLSGGVLLDRSPRCNAAEVRRMLMSCIMRSGRFPTIIRSDRGSEFKNALIQEVVSVADIGQKFGHPWRPVEQGMVENKHKETQKITGILVGDVVKCLHSEGGDLLHVVEFIIYNTPNSNGFTPRDLDRRWSTATTLERELQPCRIIKDEPVTDYVKTLYKNFREIYTRVVAAKFEVSQRRKEMTNRWRLNKVIVKGQKVLVKDPRHRKVGGRAPYKQPSRGPYLVEQIRNNDLTLRDLSDTRRALLENVHIEDVLLIPSSSRDLEQVDEEVLPEERRPDIIFEEPTEDDTRSPGQMLDDHGNLAAERERIAAPKMTRKDGKMVQVSLNSIIVYTRPERGKLAYVGRVLSASKTEACVKVQKHMPISDGNLLLRWAPVYNDGPGETMAGTRPAEEIVPARHVLYVTELHQGVLSHSTGRSLHHRGFKFDEGQVLLDVACIGPAAERAADAFVGQLAAVQGQKRRQDEVPDRGAQRKRYCVLKEKAHDDPARAIWSDTAAFEEEYATKMGMPPPEIHYRMKSEAAFLVEAWLRGADSVELSQDGANDATPVGPSKQCRDQSTAKPSWGDKNALVKEWLK